MSPPDTSWKPTPRAPKAVEIIRSLVDQVIFRPTAEAGLEVELVGDIARMVHLAQNSNETAPFPGPFTMSSLVR